MLLTSSVGAGFSGAAARGDPQAASAVSEIQNRTPRHYYALRWYWWRSSSPSAASAACTAGRAKIRDS